MVAVESIKRSRAIRRAACQPRRADRGRLTQTLRGTLNEGKTGLEEESQSFAQAWTLGWGRKGASHQI
jgi:hypothetical protein